MVALVVLVFALCFCVCAFVSTLGALRQLCVSHVCVCVCVVCSLCVCSVCVLVIVRPEPCISHRVS